VWLRWAMNQAAQTAKRSPQFAASYAAIAKRRGKQIATIAIARKLVTRAWQAIGWRSLECGRRSAVLGIEAFAGHEHNDLVLWMESRQAVIAGDCPPGSSTAT
jgi:hypothetical protein